MNRALASAPDPQIGRRGRNRLRARLAARIVTIHGTRNTVLLDLSASGARIRATEDMAKGQQAMLTWSRYEAIGSLVWVEDGLCGIAFHDALLPEVLIATRDLDAIDRLPGEREPERTEVRAGVAGIRRV
nr:PilZ domain-containing protein [Novosphingobium sp. Gsoil 351]